MARRSQKRSEGRKVTKQWYKVIGPEMFGNSPVGETLASDPNKLVGRVIETTLGELTNNFSKQNTKLKFKIDKVGGDAAYTRFVGHELTTDYIRSLVKRRTTRIDAIIDVTTSDGYKVRVKPTCFTVKRARSNQIKIIRQIARNIIQERAGNLDLNQFIQEIVLGRLSLDIYKDAKAVYPLRRVEIRKTEIRGVNTAS